MSNNSSHGSILVTGSSGYLGSLVIHSLRKKYPDTTIIGLDVRDPSKSLPNNVIFEKKSILDSSLSSVFEEHHPDVVIHLAFTVTPIHKKKLSFAKKVDLEGTETVLKLSQQYAAKQFIHISSTLAYGALEDNPEFLTEEDPLRAKETFHYAYHKRLVEETVLPTFLVQKKMILTVLRPSGFLGPSISNYISKILRGRFLPVIRKADDIQIQWAHEEDVVQAILNAIERKKHGIFNITSDDTVTMKEIAKILPGKRITLPESVIRLGLRLQWWLRLGQSPPGYLDFVRYPFVASNKKAKEELNWYPQYSSVDALKTLLPEK